jgi:hypothetical protein
MTSFVIVRESQLDNKNTVTTMDLLLFALMLGVWGSFMAYGWVLEDIKSTPWGDAKERFTDTDFLILAQSVGNAAVAAVLLLFFKDGPVLHRCVGGAPHALLLLSLPLSDATFTGACYCC